MQTHESLRVLHADVERRCAATVAQHPEWPCRKGCDLCCRRLARIPELTSDELHVLVRAVRALPEAQQRNIGARLEALRSGVAPFTCPFLDPHACACMVYEARPVACRTYGFYADREAGLYCAAIKAQVESGAFHNVIWGNAEAVEARLGSERITLTAAMPALARTLD